MWQILSSRCLPVDLVASQTALRLICPGLTVPVPILQDRKPEAQQSGVTRSGLPSWEGLVFVSGNKPPWLLGLVPCLCELI